MFNWQFSNQAVPRDQLYRRRIVTLKPPKPAKAILNDCLRVLARTPRFLALLVVAAYAVLVLARLNHAHWDASRFVVAGDQFVDKARLPVPIAVLPHSAGYDGQFYYRFALNPFTNSKTENGITIDSVYRAQRIGYPMLAWIFSGGGTPRLVPWVMIGLNLVALGALALLSAKLALRNNIPAWLALLPSLYPGFFLTIIRDTTEIVAATFAFAALSFAERRSFWKAAPLAVAAVLTRETTLLYLLGFGVTVLFKMIRSLQWSWDIAAIALPAITLLVWHWVLFVNWGQFPLAGGNLGILGPPLLAIWGPLKSHVLGHSAFGVYLHAYYVIAVAFCGLILLIVGWGACMSTGPAAPLVITWAAYATMTLSLTAPVWADPFAFLRAFADCYVTGMVLLILFYRPSAYLASVLVGLMWVPTFWYGFVYGG
jgi:hypothetical protein